MDSSIIISKPKANGWKHVRTKGDHWYFWKEGVSRRPTCVPHPKKDLPIGTVKAIERQTGISFK